jgi:hypothetical protein
MLLNIMFFFKKNRYTKKINLFLSRFLSLLRSNFFSSRCCEKIFNLFVIMIMLLFLTIKKKVTSVLSIKT